MKYRKIAPNTLVKIMWADSSFVKGWHYPVKGRHRFTQHLHYVGSVGWVVDANPETLIIAGSHDIRQGVLNPLIVPWGMISELREV